MRCFNRLVLVGLLIGVAPAISGCADFDLDKLDVLGLNKKKPLPGERHAVFPEGVPGVTQGIPPELMPGGQQAQPGAAVAVESVKPAETKMAAVQPVEKPKVKPKPRPKPKEVVQTSRPTRIQMSPQEQQAQPAAAPSASVQPPAQPTAPQQGWPAPAQSSAPWPDPPPSGTFSKQQ
jgi:hypothetical protein